MWILGIAASHNAAAALIRDGRVVVAIQTERLSRKKRDGFTLDNLNAKALRTINYCLATAKIGLEDLECIATCTPWDKIQAVWADPTFEVAGDSHPPRFVSVPHHLAHAEYVIHYVRPSCPSLVLICDGSGTWESLRQRLSIQEIEDSPYKVLEASAKESISAYRFDEGALKLVYRFSGGHSGHPHFLNSVGHVWRWAAQYCHGNHNEAGKVMGLAPYGDPGTLNNLNYLTFSEGKLEFDFVALSDRFRTPNVPGWDVTGIRHYADLAASLQSNTNAFLRKLLIWLRSRCTFHTVCYSGGLALNGIANEIVSQELDLPFEANGSCEDNGTAIGAALAAYHHISGMRTPEMLTDYYGIAYSDSEIESALRSAHYDPITLPQDAMLDFTAEALSRGKIIGWFQGRSEFGPRALGNRSILADARRSDMKDTLNKKVKFRESFRPYAPATLEDRAEEFFLLRGVPSPVMLRVCPVKVKSLPAITHVDGSARVQTVNRAQNSLFYDLIERFGRLTNVPVLLNTSFNVAGEPIVESPVDALRTFAASRMDILVMGHYIIEKPGASHTSPLLERLRRIKAKYTEPFLRR